MRLLLAGGGTGGHLIPGAVIAQAVRERGGDALFATAGRAIEGSLLEGLPSASLALEKGAGAPGTFEMGLRLPAAISRARDLIREFRAEVVLGLGGLASFPVALAARLAGAPLVLLEINAVPGRATRWLAPLAQRILVASEEAARKLGPRALLTGMPLRKAFASLPPRADARIALGLAPDRPVLLVLGGSQGAFALNRAVGAILDELRALRVQLLWITGAGKDGEARSLCADRPGLSAVVRDFIADAPSAYAAADLAFCRTGAATVAELAAAGLPAIAVPYPHHRDRQQLRNARLLGGGAEILEEGHLTPSRLLSSVRAIVEDPGRRRAMSEASRRAARPRALEDVLTALENVRLRRALITTHP